MQAPVDFVGINYYTRAVVQRRPARLSRSQRAALLPARTRRTRRPAGRSTRRASPTPCSGCGALRRRPALRHRERRGVLRPAAAPSRASMTRSASHYLRDAPRRGPPRHRRRRRRARLLRLVASRQPGVGARLSEALRHRPRRLRDAEADAEGQRAVLPGSDPRRRRIGLVC